MSKRMSTQERFRRKIASLLDQVRAATPWDDPQVFLLVSRETNPPIHFAAGNMSAEEAIRQTKVLLADTNERVLNSASGEAPVRH